MEILNNMNLIHDKKLKIIFECNLLHDILNTSKRTKNINIHYSTFYMDVWVHVEANIYLILFEYFWIVDVFPKL